MRGGGRWSLPRSRIECVEIIEGCGDVTAHARLAVFDTCTSFASKALSAGRLFHRPDLLKGPGPSAPTAPRGRVPWLSFGKHRMSLVPDRRRRRESLCWTKGIDDRCQLEEQSHHPSSPAACVLVCHRTARWSGAAADTHDFMYARMKMQIVVNAVAPRITPAVALKEILEHGRKIETLIQAELHRDREPGASADDWAPHHRP